ncbi:hypothetical protein FJTKL_02134 [Diaporthe vaccinii]|uniref:RING-type domain-containing protein n=1 Tax=Diaporthe vaccinii TaxID=105482 RepID=A0ABR4DYT5_9PEZI
MLSVKGPGALAPAAVQEHEDQDSLDLSDKTKSQCRISVSATLPGIDPEYLARVCTEAQWDPNRVIDLIFDQVEEGKSYPRAPKPNLLKRKREDDDEQSNPDNAAAKFDNEERRRQAKATSYKKTCDAIMQQSFPQFYADDLRKTLAEHGNCLYPAFLAVTATVASSNNHTPYKKKSKATHISGKYDVGALTDRIRSCADQGEREALEEFRALKEVQSKQRAEFEVERKREEDEKANLEAAMLEGNAADCGCCFVEYALNRMVHCDGEILHWFCRDCARTMAETQIGLSKYRLDCMSTDGCMGGFAMDQKEIFLDTHSMTALDRIEQEAVLREAGIENLETCPQCPFAAEYPPIGEDKDHFNDASRGGRTGNCPLFDDGYGVEKRHQEEVRAAEEQSRKRALERHPDVQADLLEFRLSEKVRMDEKKKTSAQQR